MFYLLGKIIERKLAFVLHEKKLVVISFRSEWFMKLSIRHRYIKKIPMLEVTPEELKNEPLPLIVYYHGWQSTKELSLTQARKLAQKGLRVILPDAMNHGERKSGPISTIPSVTFWSSIQYNILEFAAIIRHFQKQELITNNSIGVGGVSMGGITTCALMTQHPEIKAAACIMGTPYPSRYIQRVMTHAKELKVFVPQDLPLSLSWVTAYDLSQQPETINERSMLFWHGTQDKKIPYEDMANFQTLIAEQSYAQKVQFITGENQPHLITGTTMNQVAAFFEKELLKIEASL
jgi:dienelactone hydrolase